MTAELGLSDNRSRLEKLIGMLGSDHDGEIVNAARMIRKIAESSNQTIASLIMSPQTIFRDRVVEKTVYKDRPGDPQRDKDPFADDLKNNSNWRQQSGRSYKRPNANAELMENLRYAASMSERFEWLNHYELEFLDSVLSQAWWDEDLTVRQEKVARRIIAKVRAMSGDSEPLI